MVLKRGSISVSGMVACAEKNIVFDIFLHLNFNIRGNNLETLELMRPPIV